MFLAKLITLVFASALLVMPAAANPQIVDGIVSYRGRIALPPGAQLHVSLVALSSATPVVGAGAIIPTRGQGPLSFTLNIRTDLAPGAYGIIAEIRQGQRPLMRNNNPVPVDLSSGQPVEVTVSPMLVAQSPTPPAPPSELIDIVWTVTSVGGRPIMGDRPLTLSMAADQRAGGNGGCNDYFAEARIEDDAMSFGPAAATRMACAADIMAQEAAYFAALAAVASYELDGNSLRLLDAAGIPLIGLVRQEN